MSQGSGTGPFSQHSGSRGGRGDLEMCRTVWLSHSLEGQGGCSLHVVDVCGARVGPERGFHRTLSGERMPPTRVYMALSLTGPMYSWLPRAQIQCPWAPVLEVRAECPLIPRPSHTWALCGRPVTGLVFSRNPYSEESASKTPYVRHRVEHGLKVEAAAGPGSQVELRNSGVSFFSLPCQCGGHGGRWLFVVLVTAESKRIPML